MKATTVKSQLSQS